MGDQLQTEAIVLIFLLVKSFSSHYHPFSLRLKHRQSVHFWNVMQSYTRACRWGVSPHFWLIIFFGLVLVSWKLQISRDKWDSPISKGLLGRKASENQTFPLSFFHQPPNSLAVKLLVSQEIHCQRSTQISPNVLLPWFMKRKTSESDIYGAESAI